MEQVIGSRKKVMFFHLVVSLMMVCFYIRYQETYDANVKGEFRLVLLCIVYILTLLFFFLFNKGIFSKIAIIPVVIICACESFSGISQLLGYTSSNHNLFSITGSFKNPGPYGGFLAVCISLLIAYSVKYREDNNQKALIKLMYYGVLVVAVTATTILPSTQSRSSILALGCSMFLLAFGTDRIRVKIKPFLKRFGLWLTLGIVIVGICAYLFKKQSADGRLFMDRICVRAMCENGWKGVGLGHFGVSYGQAQARFFQKTISENGKDNLDWRVIDEHTRMTADCPDNAFNEYLFIGVEEGFFTMLLFIAIIITAIVVSFRRRTIWCYGLTSFAIFALFSFPLHVVHFQIMIMALLAACVQDGLSSESKESRRYYCVELTLMVAALMIMVVEFLLKISDIRCYEKIENAWKNVDRWHKMGYYEYVVEDCDTLIPYLKHDEKFLFAYGQSLNKTGNYEKSDSVLKLGTRISSDPMFWNVMGNNSLALGRYREAEERYKYAFYMVPNRLYPLYLLAKLYHAEGDTVRFLDMADKVETFIPKIESANTELLRSEIREIKTGYEGTLTN